VAQLPEEADEYEPAAHEVHDIPLPLVPAGQAAHRAEVQGTGGGGGGGGGGAGTVLGGSDVERRFFSHLKPLIFEAWSNNCF